MYLAKPEFSFYTLNVNFQLQIGETQIEFQVCKREILSIKNIVLE